MKYRMIICAIVSASLLAGCTEDDEPVTVAVTPTESADNTAEAQESELYSTFDSIALDFMTAMRTQDLNILKEIVSSEFEIKIEDNQWLYVMDEPVDNQQYIPLYGPDSDLVYWHVVYSGPIPDYAGQESDSEEYGVSIRIFTDEEKIETDMAEVINLHLKQIDGEWKIVRLDNFV